MQCLPVRYLTYTDLPVGNLDTGTNVASVRMRLAAAAVLFNLGVCHEEKTRGI